MADKIAFSGKNLELAEAVIHHNVTAGALTLFFSTMSPSYSFASRDISPKKCAMSWASAWPS